MTDAILEIRDYTIDPAWLDAHKKWATGLAAPWLKAHWDIIDMWIDDDMSTETSEPSTDGQPNVCWAIHWPDMRTRTEAHAATFDSHPDWIEIWSQHPNPAAQRHVRVRFMKSVV